MVYSDQTHIDPADYFRPDASVPEQPLISKLFYPIAFPAIGTLSVLVARYMTKRPLFGGLPHYALAISLGITGGFFMESAIQKKAMKRDAMIYDYIKKHPEDFPIIERVKYKDVLERWFPIRHGK